MRLWVTGPLSTLDLERNCGCVECQLPAPIISSRLRLLLLTLEETGKQLEFTNYKTQSSYNNLDFLSYFAPRTTELFPLTALAANQSITNLPVGTSRKRCLEWEHGSKSREELNIVWCQTWSDVCVLWFMFLPTSVTKWQHTLSWVSRKFPKYVSQLISKSQSLIRTCAINHHHSGWFV